MGKQLILNLMLAKVWLTD